MTIDSLYKKTQACSTFSPVQAFEGWVIGVDGDLHLVQALKGGKGKAAAMKGLLWKILSMLEAGIKPVLVFDGERPALKQAVRDKKAAAEREKELQNEAKPTTVPTKRHKKKADTDQTFNREPRPKFCFKCRKSGHEQDQCPTNPTGIGERLRFTSTAEKRQVRSKGKDLDKRQSWLTQFPYMARIFELIGIPVIQGNMESDEVLAALSLNGIIDAAASDDMDTIAFGCKALIRRVNFTDGLKQTVVEILYKDDVMDILGFHTDEEFVKMCTLCKNDYSVTSTLSPKKATVFVESGKWVERGTPQHTPDDGSSLDWDHLWKVQDMFNSARSGALPDLCSVTTPDIAQFEGNQLTLDWSQLEEANMSATHTAELLSLLLASKGFTTERGIVHAKNVVIRASRGFGCTLVPSELTRGQQRRSAQRLVVALQFPRPLRQPKPPVNTTLQMLTPQRGETTTDSRDETEAKNAKRELEIKERMTKKKAGWKLKKKAEQKLKQQHQAAKRTIAKELRSELEVCKARAAKKREVLEAQLQKELAKLL